MQMIWTHSLAGLSPKKPIKCDLKHARHIYLAEYLTWVYANTLLGGDLSIQSAEISTFGSVLCKEKGDL